MLKVSSLPQSRFLLKLQVEFAEAAAKRKQCDLDFPCHNSSEITLTSITIFFCTRVWNRSQLIWLQRFVSDQMKLLKLVCVSDCWGVWWCSIEFDYVSIVELFDYRTFDCFRLANFFLWVRLSTITEPNWTQSSDWVRLPNVRLTTSGIFK